MSKKRGKKEEQAKRRRGTLAVIGVIVPFGPSPGGEIVRLPPSSSSASSSWLDRRPCFRDEQSCLFSSHIDPTLATSFAVSIRFVSRESDEEVLNGRPGQAWSKQERWGTPESEQEGYGLDGKLRAMNGYAFVMRSLEGRSLFVFVCWERS
jgi:hypothetical protein